MRQDLLARLLMLVPFVTLAIIGILLSGCTSLPGLVPAIGGQTKIEREFKDPDTSYTESIKAPAGVEVDNLSKFSLELKQGEDVYKVGMDGEAKADTTGQAALLMQISADTTKALADLTSLLSRMPALTPAPAPAGNPIADLTPERLEQLRLLIEQLRGEN